jgi:transcriptional regulator with XRE-family HTH domain
MDTFGGFIKKLRMDKRLTLRQFCVQTELDPSNWSKVERNILPPPKSKMVLQRIAKVLDMNIESDTWYTLVDLAMIASIPIELMDDKSILDKLPILFRTVRGESPTRDELEKLIKLLKES